VPPFVLPVIAGLAAAAGSWYWAIYPSLADAAAAVSLGGTVASVGTTGLGFMIAALAVLASINHTHLVEMMRVYGHYHDLLTTMMVGCLVFLACAIVGFLMLFGVPCVTNLLIGLVALHVSALVSLIDIGRKLWYVLTNLRSE
jgi:hypothetical protein